MVIAVVYLGVDLGRSTPACANSKLDSLSVLARQYSGPIRQALNRSMQRSVLDARVRARSRRVGHARDAAGRQRAAPQGPQLYVASDSTAEHEIPTCSSTSRWRPRARGRSQRGTEAGDDRAAWPRPPCR